MKNSKAYFRGCLLGGAVGDALGYPVEFLTREEIKSVYGENGLRDLVCEPQTGKALVSDDTQTAAFTVDGLVWADSRAKKRGIYAYTPCIFYSYQKWLYTQTGHFAEDSYKFLLSGEILRWDELYARRTPGEAVLQALAGSINGKYGTMRNPINNNKGYNAVARAAPIGLYFYDDPRKAFKIGAESAAITHGHPTACMTAGYLAYLTAMIIQGYPLERAASEALAALKRHGNSGESYEKIREALELSGSDVPAHSAMERLGRGFLAEEAMALGLYCALTYPEQFEEALCLAVNQDGNSDGAAAICGNLLGAYLGNLEIPYSWMQKVELYELMVIGADKLLAAVKDN